MKRTKNIFIILACLIVLGAAAGYIALYKYLDGPVEMKVFTGAARILMPPLNVTVKVDGIVIPDARVFAMDKSFDGHPLNDVVLWLPAPDAPDGREVIMVNRTRRKVGQGNTSNRDYALWFGRFLFQADSGAWFIPFDDNVKGPGIDPKLKLDGNNISFLFPDQNNKLRKVEINENK